MEKIQFISIHVLHNHCIICIDFAFMIVVELRLDAVRDMSPLCGLVESWFQAFTNHVLVLRSLCQFWQTLLVCMSICFLAPVARL